jgi:hypothetical protein
MVIPLCCRGSFSRTSLTKTIERGKPRMADLLATVMIQWWLGGLVAVLRDFADNSTGTRLGASHFGPSATLQRTKNAWKPTIQDLPRHVLCVRILALLI